jgi:hypothetical protein
MVPASNVSLVEQARNRDQARPSHHDPVIPCRELGKLDEETPGTAAQ